MKHLFVPYPIALALKEKGFDEGCLNSYDNDNEDLADENFYLFEYCNTMPISTSQLQGNQGMENWIAAPLYQQVEDFFRSKGINIYIEKAFDDGEFIGYDPVLQTEDGIIDLYTEIEYIDAKIAAITHALTLLP